MTKEAQRLAIAEACGWTLDHIRRGAMYYVPSIDAHVGDPLHDLNAMHQAESTLNPAQILNMEEEISIRQRVRPSFRATAAERAEAFLRTVGKWQEV